MSNLIDNGLKYTPKGSITIKAEVCPNAEGGEKIMITVSDTGSGMTKEEIEKLFQTFSMGAAGLMYWM